MMRTFLPFCTFIFLNIGAAPAVIFGQTAPSKTAAADSVRSILSSSTRADQEFAARKYQFIREAVAGLVDSTSGASLSLRFEGKNALPFFLDADGLKGLNPDGIFRRDDIPQARNRDIPPTISLNQAVESIVESYKKSRRNARRNKWPVPTDLEIDVLKVLWVEGKATSGEIYAKLDTSTMIFAEELQNVLKNMVDRGFLDRKQISPSHELSLFGFAKIELSSKNRKNKVYLYWPIVTRKKLHSYLDAKRYLALVASHGENDVDIKHGKYVNNYQKYLEKKLYRMFE